MPGPDVKPHVARDDPCADPEAGDEAELIERAKRLPQEFGPLYERYYGRILGYAYRRTLDAAVAEELTSNTFFKVLRALPEYEHRGRFSAWLYRIATNEIRAHRRAASRRPEGNDRWREELDRVWFDSQGPDSEEDVAEKMQAFAQLHDALVRPEETGVTDHKTSWQDHLNAIRHGKRVLLDLQISRFYTYEVTLDDGSTTTYQIASDLPAEEFARRLRQNAAAATGTKP